MVFISLNSQKYMNNNHEAGEGGDVVEGGEDEGLWRGEGGKW